MIDVILTTNSPGEVSAWVKPVVKKLNELNIDKNIYVFTPPCVFSSGNEGKVISEIEGVTETYNKKDYLKYILLNKRPQNFDLSEKGFVLFLGGDFMHAVFLGKRLNYPVYSYTERDFGFTNSVKKFYLSDENVYHKLINAGVSSSKLKIVGNLMFDSINPVFSREKTRELLGKEDEEILINLLPGSRPQEFKYVLPLFLNTVRKINKTYDNSTKKLKYILSKADFVDISSIKKILKSKRIEGKVEYFDTENLLMIDDNIKIKIYEDKLHSIMRESDFALTIPGTNNLELAVLETPMIVILPLNEPSLIPLPGLIGMIGEIPYLGEMLKSTIIPKKVKNRDYISIVNSMANERIVPELIGKFSSDILSEEVLKLIGEEPLQTLKNKLKTLKIDKGASDEIVRDIISDLY
ncbi:MAG: hypothetical protein K9K76_02990 [Halanaerobiales bacterium]|nr:hypothetical protein [Halanaerobiales bacterium]